MSESINFLLKTKLFVPRARRPGIDRPALLERLEHGSAGALTILSAPAGFGKTTLLADWAAKKKAPVAWFSLDVEDNFPARFLTYLTASLQTLGLRMGNILDALQKSQNIPAQTVLGLILQELETPETPFWLVLDDYHLITERTVHALLQYLLDHRPPMLHLVIATRADPPIPLARLRSRGDLFELRAADLCFSSEETAAFFKRCMGLALSPAEIDQLEQSTEGWVAGLQMVALALQSGAGADEQAGTETRAAFLQSFSGSHRFVLDYLVEEVLAHQPAEVQEFLLRTSILDRFCAGLCAAVMQPSLEEPADHTEAEARCQALLNRLERDNLFLFPLDDERKWYRYHHLFSDLLRARLQQTASPTLAQTHLLAARWLERNGEINPAVQQAFAAGEHDLAADWIERYGQERWAKSDTSFLMLAHQLPTQTLEKRPVLATLYAWTSFIFGQLGSAQDLLQMIETNLCSLADTPENQGLRAFIDLFRLYLADLSGKTSLIALPDPQALEHIPAALLGMRNTADVILAMLYSARSSFHTVEKLLQETIRRDIMAGGTTAIPLAGSLLARNLILQGHLQAAEQTCRENIARIPAGQSWQYYLAGNLYVTLADVLLEWNRLDDAEAALSMANELNEPWNIPSATAMQANLQARLMIARGNRAEAQRILQQGLNSIEGRFIPTDTCEDLLAIQSSLWLDSGDLSQPEQWAKTLSPYNPLDCRQERAQLVRARLYLAQAHFAEALELLETLAVSTRSGGRWGSLARILLWQCQAYEQTGERQKALDKLDDCLTLAAPEGALRLFLELGEPARVLLNAYLHGESGSQKLYARRVLAAFEPAAMLAPAASVSAAGLVEDLSVREMEVLGLLCEGLSNRAIAQRLFITLSAVKKHTGNIFGKLGVNSRTQAIVRARELGLVTG